MNRRPRGARARVALTAVLCAAGCATASPRQRAAPAARETAAAWRDLVEGRDAAAAGHLAVALRDDPTDDLARFGRAALAFERGDARTALFDNLALLEGAARSDASARSSSDPSLRPGSSERPAMRAMAAGRLGVLLDEFPGSAKERQDVEARVMGLLDPSGWDWRTRYELAMLADSLARRRSDSSLLASVARRSGCIRDFQVLPASGLLPHVDLDAPASRAPAMAPPPGARPWPRALHALGCRVSLPSFENRGGAQRVAVGLDIAPPVSGGGPREFDVVLDFSDEARLIVDGGPARHHGGEFQFGPRVSATRVSLAPGHHDLELRMASYGGRLEVALMLVPVRADAEPSRSLTSQAVRPPPAVAPDLSADVSPAAALAALYVTNRIGDAQASWSAAARLDSYPRFALGRALQAAARRDDPSVPADLARDRARAGWQEALAVDPELARSRNSLAGLDLEEERFQPAIEEAETAARSAPDWWLPSLTLAGAYRLRGLDFDADRSLARAIELGGDTCAVMEAALSRAEDRREVAREAHLAAALGTCVGGTDVALDRLRKRGDVPGATALLRQMVRLAPERDALKKDLAASLVAGGKVGEALEILEAVIEPTDGEGAVRLADTLMAAGQPARARAVLQAALSRRPDLSEVVRAARALGIPLPLEPFRIDGRQVIHAFEASGRRYRAPAVVVLDRTVTRLFPDGAEMTLTHEIVRVQSKEAVEKWGEISLPERAEILTLRTLKADGSTREPEEVAGKASVSAADLAIGDYVEKEILELHAPDEAFASTGGFVGERFFFQSFDAPLDRTEYLVVTDPETAPGARLSVDARAGAPESVESRAKDGSVVITFAREGVAQKFPERSSVPAIEVVPSVRVVRAASWGAWTQFLREQTYGTQKDCWAVRALATEVRQRAQSPEPGALAMALVALVGHRIEDEEDLRESAAYSLARGRGNRVAVILAVSRLLNLPADLVVARSRLVAEASEPTPIAERDDFTESLIRFRLRSAAAGRGSPPGGAAAAPAPIEVVYSDPRLKHAPLGYLAPGLEGAAIVFLGSGPEPGGAFGIAEGAAAERAPDHGDRGDGRRVEIALQLDAQGAGRARVVEELRGWPALEWAEVVDKLGNDREKMRQDFEQRWLGVQFAGAVLENLNIDIRGEGGHMVSSLVFPVASDGSGRGAGHSGVAGEPYAADRVRLTYSFSIPRMAVVADHELRFQPTFFRSLPGRRYAAEPRRETTLATGFDVPLDLRTEIELPPGARVKSALTTSTSVAPHSGYRFTERRRVERRADGREVIELRREARLPILRITPVEYPRVAAELRQVDSAEQEEIRIQLPPSAEVVR